MENRIDIVFSRRGDAFITKGKLREFHHDDATLLPYVGQNMLEWNMGGNFNFIEQ
jgi:hypothetical protein